MTANTRRAAVATGSARSVAGRVIGQSDTTDTSPEQKCPQIYCFIVLVGTILTCVTYQSPKSAKESSKGMTVAGPTLLAVGLTLLCWCILAPLYRDFKRNDPSQNWNERIRNDSRTLSWVLIIPSIPLACVGFNRQNSCYEPSALGIAGLGIMTLGELVMLSGFIHGRCTTDGQSDTRVERILSEIENLSWALFIPGICLSCVGWIQYYECLLPGILGAIFSTIGGSLIITHCITRWRCGKSLRYTMLRLSVLLFYSGIVMTSVGFSNRPAGLVLGIVGACCLGIFVLSHILKCLCERPAGSGRSTNTTASTAADAEIGAVTSASPFSMSSHVTATAPPVHLNDSNDLPSYADTVSNGNHGTAEKESSFAPSYYETNVTTQEDEPPPPSYDEAVK